MRKGKLYCKADNPKVTRHLKCGDAFAAENGWIAVDSLTSTTTAKTLEPYDKKEAEPEVVKKEIEEIEIPEIKETPKPTARKKRAPNKNK